ncbi:ribosomal protein L7/L12 [Kitasatospora griseola]|uniref:ribosomal protein L7/L12 n=1 Tax=Kitasatospora griseola TaxID=2064 RepID=UPI0038560397
MEDPEFIVQVAESEARGREVLCAVVSVTGLSLWHSKLLLDSAPATVLEKGPFAEAVAAARRLQEVGVPATVRCTWCDRAVPRDGTLLDPGPCASRHWPTAHCRANSLTSCDCEFCRACGPVYFTR